MSTSTWLAHHGILGQKWGIRRFQNEDGSLTSAGRRRYEVGDKMVADKHDSSVTKRVKKDYNDLSDDDFRRKYSTSKDEYRKRVNKYGDPYMNSPLAKMGKKLKGNRKELREINPKYAKQLDKQDAVQAAQNKDSAKKIAKGVAIGAAVVGGTLLAAYGAKKLNAISSKNSSAAKTLTDFRKEKGNVRADRVFNQMKSRRQKTVDATSLKSVMKSSPVDTGADIVAELLKSNQIGLSSWRNIGK